MRAKHPVTKLIKFLTSELSPWETLEGGEI